MQALTKKLQKARNFSATALILMQSFIRSNGWPGVATFVGAAGLGFIQPIPLAFLAQIAMTASKGAADITFHTLTLSLSTAFYIAIALVLIEVLITHGMDRLVLSQNTKWQDRMFKSLLDGAPRSARPYYLVYDTQASSSREYVQSIIRAVTSASVFGRIVTRALKDGTSAIVALVILTWLDVSTLAIIAIVSCLLLPLFARATTNFAKSRLINRNRMLDVLPEAVEWAERGTQNPSTSTAPRTALESDTVNEAYRPLYEMPNQTKFQFSKFQLLSGLNFVAVLLAIFIWNGASVQNLLQTKLNYLAILIVFLRSIRGITTGIAQFSQNYTPLAMLRSFVAPRSKSLVGDAYGLHGGYTITDVSGRKIAVNQGQPIYVLMPPVRFGFQLVGLSNAMHPHQPSPRADSIWLSLYQPENPKEALAASILVVNEADWPTVDADDNRELRSVFVILPETTGNSARDTTRSIIVWDGDEILAVGTYAECYDRFAGKFSAARKKRKSEVSEEEELE
jgi:ABC-type multidrug transport system fused ATPase/permease subunit